MKTLVGVVYVSLLLVSCIAFAETATCTVTVVDTLGDPVKDAEVSVYECVWEYLTNSPATRILCPCQKNDMHGRTTLKLELSKNSQDEMVLVRKSGCAMGWDLMPRIKPAVLNINIVLDNPLVLGGSILDQQGKPIVGASVQAQPKTTKMMRLSQRPVLVPADWLTVPTDSSGRFQFHCFGQDTNADFLVTIPGIKTVYKFSNNYSCGYKIGRDDIRLQLPKQGTLNVQVIDDERKPLAGITAVLRPDHRNSDFAVNYIPLRFVTDENGRCVFENIPANKHLLGIHNLNDSTPLINKTLLLNTKDAPDKQDVVVKLERGAPVKITMLDESTKKSISDMHLMLYQQSSDPNLFPFIRSFDTDINGKAELIAPAGDCELNFYDDRYEKRELEFPELKKGQAETLNFEVTPIDPIAGVVNYASGKPAVDVPVKLTWGSTAFSDNTGAFKCTYGRTTKGMCLIARDVQNNGAVIYPIKKDIEKVLLTLQPAKTLKGSIVDPNGNPIPAARVEISFSGPGYLADCCPEILTAKDGTFEFNAIPAIVPDGFSFRISVITRNHGAMTYEKLQVQNESDQLIELKPIQMFPADLVTNGVAVDKDGNPVARLPIFLQGDNQYEHRTVTDENGRFQLDRLCRGEIRLQAALGGDDNNIEPGFITAQAGDSDVIIILGQKRTHIVPGRSLVGTKLAALSEIKIPGFSWNAVYDKSLLLFFWDYNQRPSRFFVKSLAANEAMLKERDITVVLLNVAPADKSLENWLKENQITYTCGIIDKDIDEFKSRMGIQSLPWLILTDKNKKVAAEGFSVDEIKDKLNSI